MRSGPDAAVSGRCDQAGVVLAVLLPGQGSQRPGMLAPWLEQPGAADDIERWSAAVGVDLRRLGTAGSAEEVRDTAVAQPLLTAVGLLSARALLGDLAPDVVCGHSVGELPALALAGVVDPAAAVALAAERGRAMSGAAAQARTGMTAVLGGDPDDVAAHAHRAGLAVATVNAPGQLVVGGPLAALTAFEHQPPVGARARRLDVAGAFHTAAMAPAVPAFAAAVDRLAPSDARCRVVANADGEALTQGPRLLRRLVAQVTAPVRFDRCVARLAQLGATAVVEAAPGGVLAAIARRALPDVPVVALRDADDLVAARALLPVAAA